MTARRYVLVAPGLALVMLAGCGKKGDPLPPLRPVPARITDLTVSRAASRIELRFTVPSANVDGSTPAALTRVDIYGVASVPAVPAGVPGPAASAPAVPAALSVPPVGTIISDPRNLRQQVAVRAAGVQAATATTPATPGPGELVTVINRLAGSPPAATSLSLVVVPVAGSGRGRQGPPTAVVVPLGPGPSVPAGLVLSHDETQVKATWQPGGDGQRFRVARVVSVGAEPSGPALTATPLTTPDFAMPVEFGREICLTVQGLQVNGVVSVEGDWSRAVCITPADRYAPAAPSGLQVVQEGAAVTLIWTAVEAADLAGYIVLRGTGGGDDLQPLMRVPIRETTFRDANVQAGAVYVYAVYAVDNAPVPNVSQLS